MALVNKQQRAGYTTQNALQKQLEQLGGTREDDGRGVPPDLASACPARRLYVLYIGQEGGERRGKGRKGGGGLVVGCLGVAAATMGFESRPPKRATSSSDNEPEVLLEPAAPTTPGTGYGEGNGGAGRRGSSRPEAGGGGGKPWLNQGCYLEVRRSYQMQTATQTAEEKNLLAGAILVIRT